MFERSTPTAPRLLAGLIIVTIIAGGLRFYKLGAWSFESDEISALIEEQVLFNGANFSDDAQYNNQYDRLPRMVPLGYAALHAGYELFGRDEYGSRVVPAIIGTATVALVYLLLVPLGSDATALAAALLIAFWQQHVFYSQENHFYVVPVLFGCLCILLGAYEVKQSRPIFPLLLCGAGVAALFSHPVAAGAFGLACLGSLAGAIAGRSPPRLTSTLIMLAGGLTLAAIVVIHDLPLQRGWYQGLETGDSPLGAVMATVSRIGWPVVWLAALGGLFAISEGGAINWYWLAAALGSWAVIFLMPMEFVFIARYSLPLSLPTFVLAGTAVARIFCLLRTRSRAAAFTWMALAPLVGLPSLASHYLDGSRADLRSAIQYVQHNWRDGDRIVCGGVGMKIAFEHYAPKCGAQALLPTSGQTLETLAGSTGREGGGRAWIVSCTYFGGRSGGAGDGWLGRKCRLERRFEKQRYDHYRFCTDVYLYQP